MPRVAREQLQGKCNYILLQGQDDLNIFATDSRKEYFTEILHKNLSIMDVKLVAYCIMDNHVHIVLSADSSLKLAGFMSRISINYSKFYNNRTGHVGKIFNGRFYSTPVNDDRLLVNCISFIHNNPVVADYVTRPAQYKFSSFNQFISGEGFIDCDLIVEILGQFTPLQIKKYSEIKSGGWFDSPECYDRFVKKTLKDILRKYDILSEAELLLEENMAIVAKELVKQCNLSLRQISELMNIGRETLRKAVSAEK